MPPSKPLNRGCRTGGTWRHKFTALAGSPDGVAAVAVRRPLLASDTKPRILGDFLGPGRTPSHSGSTSGRREPVSARPALSIHDVANFGLLVALEQRSGGVLHMPAPMGFRSVAVACLDELGEAVIGPEQFVVLALGHRVLGG